MLGKDTGNRSEAQGHAWAVAAGSPVFLSAATALGGWGGAKSRLVLNWTLEPLRIPRRSIFLKLRAFRSFTGSITDPAVNTGT